MARLFSSRLFLHGPGVGLLFLWMIIPLGLTLYFSFLRYNLLYPGRSGFTGLGNYEFFVTDSAFWPSLWNTLLLVGAVLVISVVLGLLIAVLVNGEFFGRGIVRVMLVSPFFIMPTVNALLWKNMFMHPVYGLFSVIASGLGYEPLDFFSDLPLLSIIIMVSWQWTPFAMLIFITSLQSIDQEQREAALLDGARFLSNFRYLILPHLARPIAVVVMVQTIFHLTIFAEIFVTTGGGPGYASTNLTFLVFKQSLLQFDVGVASAGGVLAVIIANIVAFFLIRMIGRNL